jgi:teichuronic acid biosynthesis glycosyltransferase TuaG
MASDFDQLVSIITPCYNSSAYIQQTIESVINQTYTNWEMIIVDDCSTDNSKDIIDFFCQCDKRIKYLKTEFSSGSPTLPRNIGIDNSNGRYIAFLDSDDLWYSNKLEIQLNYFNDPKVALVYTNYEKISENGISKNRVIIAPDMVNYNILLRGNVIACCTCMYDTHLIGKNYFTKQGHEDYALWLKILRKGFIAKNTGQVSAKYRIRNSSLSSNKYKVIFWIYNIYRNNEKISIIKSVYFSFITLSNSFFKYLK